MAQSLTSATGRPRSLPITVATVAAVVVAGTLATVSGMTAAGASIDKRALVLPLAAGAGLLLGIVALTRFQVYVLLLLASRSVMDLTKLSQRAAGNTASTGVARALDPTALIGATFLGLAALWLLAQLHHRGRLSGSAVRRAFVLFGVSVLASVLPSTHKASAVAEGARILAVVAMFIVIEELCLDLRTVRRVIAACFASLVLPILITLGGFAIGAPRAETKGAFTRILGTYQQSNDFGRYLMLFIIMGIALHPHLARSWRLLLTLVLPVLGTFLLLTYTRTALVAPVLEVVVVARSVNRLAIAGTRASSRTTPTARPISTRLLCRIPTTRSPSTVATRAVRV